MPDDPHDIASERLAGRGRYTPSRRRLVALLARLGRPVTITELIDAGAGAQSSVYRNLAVLEDSGVVRRLPSVDDVARFELDEHLTGHHHHLACVACGRMVDVTLPGRVESSLTRAADAAGAEHGYAISAHRVELIGTCSDCR